MLVVKANISTPRLLTQESSASVLRECIRGLPIIVVKVIIFVYEKQYAWVHWGGLKSSLFSIINGTSQWSFLSPALLSLYLDRLYCIGCQGADIYRPNLASVRTCSFLLSQEISCRSCMRLVKDLPARIPFSS